MKDWKRSEKKISPRKRCRPGRFNLCRLHALQCFALRCGAAAGMSVDEQNQLYTLLDIWDGTKPGMPQDSGHAQTLREAFPSVTAFKDAMRDDVDEAVLEAGWRKCALERNGETYQAFFRPVLNAILDQVRSAKDMQHWSRDGRPEPPTDMRETPLDGDAFRKNEAGIVHRHGPDAFVLGLHLYSDASHISWSGGKCVLFGGVRYVIISAGGFVSFPRGVPDSYLCVLLIKSPVRVLWLYFCLCSVLQLTSRTPCVSVWSMQPIWKQNG